MLTSENKEISIERLNPGEFIYRLRDKKVE